jgi:hypothetical protein
MVPFRNAFAVAPIVAGAEPELAAEFLRLAF